MDLDAIRKQTLSRTKLMITDDNPRSITAHNTVQMFVYAQVCIKGWKDGSRIDTWVDAKMYGMYGTTGRYIDV